MLRANLWTAKGLVNGALGTVGEMFYEAGKKPLQDMPLVFLINFDGYSGPCLPGSRVYPVPPVIRSLSIETSPAQGPSFHWLSPGQQRSINHRA